MVPFDPLTDEALPAGTDGLILGGGFPEVHATGLSANERLRERVAALAGRGAPVVAECAGLLYLAAHAGRPADVRGPRRAGRDDPEADPRLPAGRGRGRLRCWPGRATWCTATSSTAPRPIPRPGPGRLDARRRDPGGSCGRERRARPTCTSLGWAPGRGVRFAAACGTGDRAMKRLIGVGVGPGDPELVTVKAVRVLREADVVLVPVLATGRAGPGRGDRPRVRRRGPDQAPGVRAERHRRRHPAPGRRLGRGRGRGGARRSPAAPPRSRSPPSATPTSTRRSPTWPRPSGTWCPDVTVETVPGITAMQDLAARAGLLLGEGTEPVALVPLNGGLAALDRRWPRAEPSSATRSAPPPAPRPPSCATASGRPAAWTAP